MLYYTLSNILLIEQNFIDNSNSFIDNSNNLQTDFIAQDIELLSSSKSSLVQMNAI